MSCYVYIIFSETINRYYIGVAQDLTTRIQNHNSSFYHGSHYTKQADDWVLFHFISCSSYQQAIKIEKYIKKMKSTIYIQNLKRYPEIVEKLKTICTWLSR